MQAITSHDAVPVHLEIPVGTLLAVLLALVLGLQAGRSLANLVAGNGWVFVDQVDLSRRWARCSEGRPPRACQP